MKYTSLIDNKKSSEWGLSLPEAYLFSWLWDAPSWAESLIIGTDIYYFSSRFKAIDDMPMLTNKPDTIYRYFKSLESKGLIEMKKIDGKDYMRLTQKSKTWNQEIVGNKSEHSEINPNKLGNKSESNSDLNPTDYTISKYYTIRDNSIPEPTVQGVQSELFVGDKPVSLYSFCVDVWLKKIHPGWTFSAIHGQKIKSIISKLKQVSKNSGFMDDDETVSDLFVKMMVNLPEYYKDKDLQVIDSKFNEIITEIKKGKNGKQSNYQSARNAFSEFA